MEERITREELLERLFHDDYENLKGNIEGGIPDQGSGYVPLAGDVKYKDLNKDGKIDEKDVRDIGYPKYPLYTTGMNLGVSWKGFDFSMTWSAAFKTSSFEFYVSGTVW